MSEIRNFEFGSAVKADAIGEFNIKIKSTGVVHNFKVRELKDTHVAYLVRAAQRKRNETAIISAVINFMEYALVEESSARFEEIVLGNPGLSLEEVVDVFSHVLDIVNSHGESDAPAPKKPRSRSGNPAVRAAV